MADEATTTAADQSTVDDATKEAPTTTETAKGDKRHWATPARGARRHEGRTQRRQE